MKLVEPGPQPPAFEVEYSALEADAPRVEETSPPDSPQLEASPEESRVVEPANAADDSQPSHAQTREQAPPDRESAAADQQSPSEADSAVVPDEPEADKPADEPSDGDSFGMGLDVGESSAKSDADSKPGADANAEPAGATDTQPGASSSDGDSKGKKGKRPNRRRRSRRGQKKKDGPPAQGGDS
jgi:hypothetical protein